jgi:hypothetical protein
MIASSKFSVNCYVVALANRNPFDNEQFPLNTLFIERVLRLLDLLRLQLIVKNSFTIGVVIQDVALLHCPAAFLRHCANLTFCRALCKFQDPIQVSRERAHLLLVPFGLSFQRARSLFFGMKAENAPLFCILQQDAA